jgi:hypothetical protein
MHHLDMPMGVICDQFQCPMDLWNKPMGQSKWQLEKSSVPMG